MEKGVERAIGMEISFDNRLVRTDIKKNPDAYPILALAYMGDAVMELFARDYVLSFSGEVKPGALVRASKAIITCEAQSDGIERILDKLDEKEMSVYKRGRNAKTHFAPKHGELIQYRRATGFEALMGHLYISGQTDRAKELFDLAFAAGVGDDKAPERE